MRPFRRNVDRIFFVLVAPRRRILRSGGGGRGRRGGLVLQGPRFATDNFDGRRSVFAFGRRGSRRGAIAKLGVGAVRRRLRTISHGRDRFETYDDILEPGRWRLVVATFHQKFVYEKAGYVTVSPEFFGSI